MLKKKVMGIFLAMQHPTTTKYICSLTNEKEEVILGIVNNLISDNKIEWTTMKA